MTKEELMDGLGALLDLLDAVPDGTNIISAPLPAPYLRRDQRTVELHISNNIGRIAKKLGLQATQDRNCYPDMVRITVLFEHGEIFQMAEKEAAPSDTTTGDGRA